MEDISAAVIHDVKNQLAELALRLEARGDAVRETGIALTAARRLTELLLVQRQQAGMLQANIDSSSPADLLQELAADYRSQFPNLDIHAELAGAPPYWFYDAALVRLALANAVHNACHNAHTKVSLAVRQQNGQLVFEIADDGSGFPAEKLAAIDTAPAPVSTYGTGLGLYLAGKIAELHVLNNKFGSVELANHDGAIFRLKLP